MNSTHQTSHHGNTMHGNQGADVVYARSGGAAYGDHGEDTLLEEDPTGSTAMDGDRGPDTCTAGTTVVNCES